jgi:hypothetical protein
VRGGIDGGGTTFLPGHALFGNKAGGAAALNLINGKIDIPENAVVDFYRATLSLGDAQRRGAMGVIENHGEIRLLGDEESRIIPDVDLRPNISDRRDGKGSIVNRGLITKAEGNGIADILVPITQEVGGQLVITQGGLKAPYFKFLAGFVSGSNRIRFDTDGFLDFRGGILENTASDELYGDIRNSGGTFYPGRNGFVGTVQIDGTTGTYTQQAGGTLSVDIGGSVAGTGYDQVTVSGLAALDGTLAINLLPGFTPNLGDTFTIMTFGQRSGTFRTVSAPIFSSKRFDIQYNSGNIILTVVSATSPPAPTVTGLSTSSGSTTGGTSVTLTGTDFTGVTAVTFGGIQG